MVYVFVFFLKKKKTTIFLTAPFGDTNQNKTISIGGPTAFRDCCMLDMFCLFFFKSDNMVMDKRIKDKNKYPELAAGLNVWQGN